MGIETGTVRCDICGLLCWDEREAKACCTGGEFMRSKMEAKPGSTAVAVCVNRAEFKRGTMRRMKELRFKCLWHMSVAYNLPQRLLGRLHDGATKTIQAENWGRLCEVFGGTPPGCVEITRGDDDGDD